MAEKISAAPQPLAEQLSRAKSDIKLMEAALKKRDEHARTLERENESLMEALRKLRRAHHESEDCWYSCPKSAEGCCNDGAGSDCNCGADEVNEIIDAALDQSKRTEAGK